MIIEALQRKDEYNLVRDLCALSATSHWFEYLTSWTVGAQGTLNDLNEKLLMASKRWDELIGPPGQNLNQVEFEELLSIFPKVSDVRRELLLDRVKLGLVWERTFALHALAAQTYECIPEELRSTLLSTINSLTDAEERAEALRELAIQVRIMGRDDRSQFFKSMYRIQGEENRSEAMARVARQIEYLTQEECYTFLQNVFNLQGEGNLSWLLAVLSDKLRWLNSVQRDEYFKKAIEIVDIQYRTDVLSALDGVLDKLSEAERAQILSVSRLPQFEE